MIFLSAEEEGVEQVWAYEDGEKPNESSCERGAIAVLYDAIIGPS